MFKIPGIATSILVAGFLGLACSNSSLKTSPGDAGVVGEGQTGGSISNGSSGGAGGSLGLVGAGGGSTGGTIGPGGGGGFIVAGSGSTIGPVGAGGASSGGTISSGGSTGGGGTAGNARTSSTGGQGGSASSSPCVDTAWCNEGDDVVDEEIGNADLSKECPAERECYGLYNRCVSTLCVLPEGVHCTDKITCKPGDTETSLDGYCSQSPCYTVRLCTNSIWCKYATDAGVAAFASDAAVDGDAIAVGYCGDGIVQVDLGEQCDLGTQNGIFQGTGRCMSCQWVPWLP